MGNTNPTGRGPGDLGVNAMKGWPILFHQMHSENIQLSLDRRRAKRIESFCKGISFSNRPIAINERVYLKFAEISTSWSGVVRFGFTSHDPVTLNPADLPRYACPDLTNKPGYWAKALPERFAESSNILFFYVSRNGDVMFGLNGEERGVFFGGVNTSTTLWGLIDIYGNTTAMEFVDGRQLNNLSPSSGLPPGGAIGSNLTQAISTQSLSSTGAPSSITSISMPAFTSPERAMGNIPVRYHSNFPFFPVQFHSIMGRNVVLSSDKNIAMRLVEEYCNGYVFTSRPLRCGEKLVIQILAVDKAYVGGLGFGLTATDPMTINTSELPDDSDMLLDRPEYWVVNKDVCSNAEVGDELSFYLTEEGEVRYERNNRGVVVTLMHVDKTLPLWAFFDVYGMAQQIKSLGVINRSGVPPPLPPMTHRGSSASLGHVVAGGTAAGLTVALPPPRSQPTTPAANTSTLNSSSSNISPPPRPPPPRSSPSPRRGSMPVSSPIPPSLPPKQNRPLPAQPPQLGSILTPTPLHASPPPRLPRHIPAPPPPPTTVPTKPPPALPMEETDEAADNANNECSVCFEKAVDCVLYTCGHMCMCYECALDIKSHQGALCPICRQQIRDVIKIFRS